MKEAIIDKKFYMLIAILSFLASLHAMGMDYILTSLRLIKGEFGISKHSTQWVISIYVLATGVGQIFLGVLSDRFGRKRIMLLSIICFIVGSFCSAIAPNIQYLIAARFAQGFGSCGTTLISYAIVRDLYSNSGVRAKAISYINGLGALTPLTGPFIGEAIASSFSSFRSVFWALSFLSICALVVVSLFIHETNPQILSNKRSEQEDSIIDGFINALKHPKFWLYTFTGSAALSGMVGFFSISPVVLIEELGISTKYYPMLFSSNALVFIIASFSTHKFINRYGLNKTIFIASLTTISGALLIIALHNLYDPMVVNIIPPNYLQTFGIGLLFNASLAGVISIFKTNIGATIATYGLIEFSISSLSAAYLMSLNEIKFINYAYLMCAFMCVTVSLFWTRRNK